MKHSAMILALTIALFVYAALNYYCIRRSSQALTGLGIVKTAIICALVVLAIAFPLGRLAEVHVRNALTHLLVVAGSLFLGAMFYMVLTFALVDCVRLANRFFHFLSPSFLADPYPVLRALWLALAGALCITVFVGNQIATHPRLRCLDLTVAKKSSPLHELTLAVVSDIHFGTVVGKEHMKRIVRLVKQANPDLVLFVGDVFDEDIDDEQRTTIVALLKELACPVGSIRGNG